jgi:hypothetical protein
MKRRINPRSCTYRSAAQLREEEARYQVALWLRANPRDRRVLVMRGEGTSWMKIAGRVGVAALVFPEAA